MSTRRSILESQRLTTPASFCPTRRRNCRRHPSSRCRTTATRAACENQREVLSYHERDVRERWPPLRDALDCPAEQAARGRRPLGNSPRPQHSYSTVVHSRSLKRRTLYGL